MYAGLICRIVTKSIEAHGTGNENHRNLYQDLIVLAILNHILLASYYDITHVH